MCKWLKEMYGCGHPINPNPREDWHFDGSCSQVYFELQRINDPAEREAYRDWIPYNDPEHDPWAVKGRRRGYMVTTDFCDVCHEERERRLWAGYIRRR